MAPPKFGPKSLEVSLVWRLAPTPDAGSQSRFGYELKQAKKVSGKFKFKFKASQSASQKAKFKSVSSDKPSR